MTLISGPIAPERNPNINPDYYQPRRFVISAITRGITTTITTSEENDYVLGQNVRFTIPSPYGIRALNEQTGFITAIVSTTQFIVNINSQKYDDFNASPSVSNQSPQVIAIGDVNTGAINSDGRSDTATDIPGSFINISPV
jgi:biotin carboxylase